MQLLTMPFVTQMLLVGYKSSGYRQYWGYPHYALDLSAYYAGGDRQVLASGDAEILLAGRDSQVGNVVVLRYPDVFVRGENLTRTLAARYLHLAEVSVKAGQRVRRGDILGIEGNTGTSDIHLHLEFDTDTAYPAYSPQVKGGSIIKKGIDTTINPAKALYLGRGQRIVTPTYHPSWLTADDRTIPPLP